MRQHNRDSGFSLIEALVAMTILAVAAGTLLAAVEEHTRAIAAISDRVIARWVAENHLTALQLGLGTLANTQNAGGRIWQITETRSESADPDLIRVDISVELDTTGAAPLARLTGFLDISGEAI